MTAAHGTAVYEQQNDWDIVQRGEVTQMFLARRARCSFSQSNSGGKLGYDLDKRSGETKGSGLNGINIFVSVRLETGNGKARAGISEWF